MAIQYLEGNEDKQQHVEHGEAKDASPYRGVGAREGAVGEGEHGDDQEEEHGRLHAELVVVFHAHVLVPVRICTYKYTPRE